MRPAADGLRRIAALVAMVILFGGSPANADTFWWVVLGSGEWTDGRNWVKTAGTSDRQFPNHETDTAIITESNSASITNASGGCLTVCDLIIKDGAFIEVSERCLIVKCQLKIAPNGKLVVRSDSELKLTGGEKHRIEGVLLLAGAGSKVSINCKDATFTGSGTLIGEHPDAVIQIADGLTLTSNIVIQGMMAIQAATRGTAALDNRKDVIANDAGVLRLAKNMKLSDAPTANWKAITSSGAKLQFTEAALSLAGAFECDSNGVLDFDASVTTTGCLTQPGGVDCVDASPPGVCFNWCGGADDCDGTS